jgi:hypothetical protein
MVRKQIVLDEASAQRLEMAAAVLGMSQSEVVRRALDSWDRANDEEERLAAIKRIDERIKSGALKGLGGPLGPDGKFTWKREDLYER